MKYINKIDYEFEYINGLLVYNNAIHLPIIYKKCKNIYNIKQYKYINFYGNKKISILSKIRNNIVPVSLYRKYIPLFQRLQCFDNFIDYNFQVDSYTMLSNIKYCNFQYNGISPPNLLLKKLTYILLLLDKHIIPIELADIIISKYFMEYFK